MNQYGAERFTEDARARRAFWEFLWRAANQRDIKDDRPIPSYMGDEQVQEDIKRILFPKKNGFLGLF